MSLQKIRVFVSSVQKELENERMAIFSLLTTDPFLLEHCEPVLFDREPIPARKASTPYLSCLDTCTVYLLLINREYGKPHGDLSATHQEYRHAQRRKLPTLVFIKGNEDNLREERTKEFFDEIKKDGYTYKRFIDRLDLRTEIRAALMKLVKEEFNLSPTAALAKCGEETLEAASPFESRMTDALFKEFDSPTMNKWFSQINVRPSKTPNTPAIESILRTRGLMWLDQKTNTHHALASGIVFLGKNPAIRFPQCKIMLDAYKSAELDPLPLDQDTLSLPASAAIERVIEFVQKNTRHPPVIQGIRRIMLDEYPEKAIREAIVNAIAHRDYEDASRHIMVAVYFNRIEIASPGFPPKPLTIAKLTKGKYLPCSRNAVIAQSLASLGLMEQRGSGIARMRAAMLNHGLDAPRFEMSDGYFQVILPGAGDDLKRLRIPQQNIEVHTILEALNERQKKMAAMLAEGIELSSRKCLKLFKVTRDTANRDFDALSKAGVAIRKGKGRSTIYVYSSGN